MPHYPGHYPNGTLIIKDVLINTTFYVHGYLFVDKKDQQGNDVPDEDTRILFLNNCGMKIPRNVKKGPQNGSLEGLGQAQLDARKVGFNLMLIDMPTQAKGNKSKWGIAYNLFEWYHHENAEGSVQAIKRFTGKLVEDISPTDLTDLCGRLEFKINNPGKKEPDAQMLLKKLATYKQITTPATALLILKQSADYMTTDSFKMSRAGDDHFQWIKENVADFEDMAPLFGCYRTTKP